MKDERQEVIEKLKEKTDEEVEEEFDNLIESLSPEQFWEYHNSWRGVDDVLDIMKEWDIKTKIDAMQEIKKMFKIKQHG